MCKRNGHPERSSKFICLRCLKENQVGDGIPRIKTKEKGHIKDIVCLCTGLKEKTKILKLGGAMILTNEWNMQKKYKKIIIMMTEICCQFGRIINTIV